MTLVMGLGSHCQDTEGRLGTGATTPASLDTRAPPGGHHAEGMMGGHVAEDGAWS